MSCVRVIRCSQQRKCADDFDLNHDPGRCWRDLAVQLSHRKRRVEMVQFERGFLHCVGNTSVCFGGSDFGTYQLRARAVVAS